MPSNIKPEIEIDPVDSPSAPEDAGGPDSPNKGKTKKRKRFSWVLGAFLGILGLAIIAGISAYSGYQSGIGLRKEAEGTLVSQVAQEQFELGVQDIEQGNYSRARQRFEYVIQLDPDYPGVTEKLADVLFELNTTATPTVAPTPTLVPTPDLRGEQELLDQSRQYILDSDWTNAIDTLLTLRKANPDFHTVEVDGMLFLALRNRGKYKILNEADLEGGIYDLTLAERFGPMDAEAQGLLNWTSLYITGASFWEIDWGQAAYYFGQVAPNMPNLRDSSGWTAGERYRISIIEYGYQLADAKQWCASMEQFQIALQIAYDAQVEADLRTVTKGCEGPKPKATSTP